MRKLPGGGEVEAILERLGAVRLEVDAAAAGVEAAADRQRALRDLQQHVEFLGEEVGLVTTTWQP